MVRVVRVVRLVGVVRLLMHLIDDCTTRIKLLFTLCECHLNVQALDVVRNPKEEDPFEQYHCDKSPKLRPNYAMCAVKTTSN